MPRTYKPTGTKRYKKHDETTIHAALREYEKTKCSLAEISPKYNISKSVLHRHNTRFMKKQGGQRVLSSAAEEYIVKYLNHCSDWGYPLDTYELRMLIKYYLDRSSLDIKRFKNNLPGPDFVKSFLVRNKDKIAPRISQNIKMSQVTLSAKVIETYFKELEKLLEGVLLSNIINYDETNLSNDPERKKVVYKRSAKYPERIMTHRKGSTSIMIAASADGTLLPCYVVYKAQNLEEAWVQHGPKNCRYNCTTTGWFDSKSFEDWVYNVALPHFKKKEGKKVLIGDSLSTHLSLDLIRKCKEQNVHFIFPPGSSTHLMLPLNVAFFKSIQSAWRNILFKWKKTDCHKLSTVPKCVFPILLKKLLDRLECKAMLNIVQGFINTGICPLDKNAILERLPDYNSILLEQHFSDEGQRMYTSSETEESKISESKQDQIIFISKNESEEPDLKDNQELCKRLITVPNTKTLAKCQEGNEIQLKSKLTENITKQNLYEIVKQTLENKKRKFEMESAKTTKSKTLVNNPCTIKKYKVNETNEEINTQERGSDIIMKRDDTEKQHYLNNVDYNLFLKNNKFEFKNLALYNDNFCVQEHIEISSDINENLKQKSTFKEENIEEELICEDEKVDILETTNERTHTTTMEVTSNEILEKKDNMIYILYV